MFFVVTIARVFFETNTFGNAIAFLKVLFTGNSNIVEFNISNKIINPEFLVIAIPAILGAFGFFPWLSKQFNIYMPTIFWGNKLKAAIKTIAVIATMLIVTILLISDTYNPFIYFRF